MISADDMLTYITGNFPPEHHMKRSFSPRLISFCSVISLTLGACASHPVASNQQRAGVASGSPSGTLPTRDGRNSQYTAGNTAGGANGEEYSVPTGSHIPRHYNRRGYTTDAADPLFVYDQNDIRFQSTDNVSDQLRTVPGLAVQGGR